MRLDQELVSRGLCKSRTEAQELIASGLVLVGGVVSKKQTRQIEEAEVIALTGKRQFVGRGGQKLEGVLHHVFGDKAQTSDALAYKTVLDVGSSTGGFTDCLLSYGVSHVDAVDVGTKQLHEKLRSDPRVALYENTDIRKFVKTSLYDIIVADLSFIPLSHVLSTLIHFGTKGTHYFLLIKPQFEVGKGKTKKGVVKDDDLVNEVLSTYKNEAEKKGLSSVRIIKSKVLGGDGNQEYFLYGTKK